MKIDNSDIIFAIAIIFIVLVAIWIYVIVFAIPEGGKVEKLPLINLLMIRHNHNFV